MARIKRTAKEERHLELSQVVNGDEPNYKPGDITKDNFNTILNATLNWYSKEQDYEKSKLYFIAYNPSHRKYKNLKATDFANTGFLCRMISKGFPSSDLITTKIADKIQELDHKLKISEQTELEEVEKTPNPKIFDWIVGDNLEKVDLYIDSFIKAEKAELDISLQNLSRQQQNAIKSYIESNLAIFENAYKVKNQDAESAYNLSNSDCKKMANRFRELLNILNASTFKVRKIRTPKAKPIGKIVKNVKYATAYNEYTGITPDKIVGSKIVLAFNIKGRRAIIWEAEEGKEIAFKNTSIINVSTTTSKSKTLRKPEEQLKVLFECSKMSIGRNFERIIAVDKTPRARLSEDVIFLKCWN